MRFRGELLFTLGTYGVVGSTLLVVGTFSLFSASDGTNNVTFAAGKVSIESTGCDGYGPADAGFTLTHIKPGDNNGGQEYVVRNNGTLDEWVGLMTTFPSNIPIQVQYSVEIYQPTDSTELEPDWNGDIHSHCHTGSKYRGAGGEDKNGAEFGTLVGTPITTGWISSSALAADPVAPFKLPVGYYAIIDATYQLPSDTTTAAENQSGDVKLQLYTVQVENNDGGTQPLSWDPMVPSH